MKCYKQYNIEGTTVLPSELKEGQGGIMVNGPYPGTFAFRLVDAFIMLQADDLYGKIEHADSAGIKVAVLPAGTKYTIEL